VDQATFNDAQQRFIEKHDKLVRPDHQLAVELVKAGAEYGKQTVTFLVVGNAGGLAALLALHPLLRDTNQLWLVHQVWVAALFATGLFFGSLTAAFAYLSFLGGVQTRWNIAHSNSVWIARMEFGSDPVWATKTQEAHRQRWTWFDKFSVVTSWIAVGCAVVSGLLWAIGAFLLARNVTMAVAI
jgi:hypothetical protein